jgi:hypothetical protein
METYATRWLVGAALALAGVSFIRIHISALFIGALLLASIIAKNRSSEPGFAARRLIVIVLIAAVGVVTIDVFQARFGADLLNPDELASFSDTVVDRTSGGGSAVPGDPVDSPDDVPGALALVLFRPFLWEAGEIQVLFSALETALLLGIVGWKLPTMFRNRKVWRANSLVVFSTFYVLAFSIAFSSVRNLGIIARQRTQVLALFLMVVVILGWERPQPKQRRPVGRLTARQDPTGEPLVLQRQGVTATEA